jgi:hypothetical protein
VIVKLAIFKNSSVASRETAKKASNEFFGQFLWIEIIRALICSNYDWLADWLTDWLNSWIWSVINLEDRVITKQQSKKFLTNPKTGGIIIDVKFSARNISLPIEYQSLAAKAIICFSFWSLSLRRASRNRTAKYAFTCCQEYGMEQNFVQKSCYVRLIEESQFLNAKPSSMAWRMLRRINQFGFARLSSTQTDLFLNKFWPKICFCWPSLRPSQKGRRDICCDRCAVFSATNGSR